MPKVRPTPAAQTRTASTLQPRVSTMAARFGVKPAGLVPTGERPAKRVVAALGRFGSHVWGDEGWRATEAHGVRYRGLAGHRVELNRIYSCAHVQLDVGRVYQADIVTMRVFDVLACGGFLLAERSDELGELFELGVELETWSELPELEEKLAHYLARPDEARRIAARGRAAVLERHTVRERVRRALASAGAVAAASTRA